MHERRKRVGKRARTKLDRTGRASARGVPRPAPVAPLIDWSIVAVLAEKLAESVDSEHPAATEGVVGLLGQLLSPHFALQELHGLARSALQSDRYARAQFAARLDEAVERLPELTRLGQQLFRSEAESRCCDIGTSTAVSAAEALVDFDALSEILIAAARTCDCERTDELPSPVALVIGLAAQTAPLDALREAHDRGGLAGLVGELNWLATTGYRVAMRVPHAGTPMRPMSGALPELPSHPGWEPGLPPRPDLPNTILGWLKNQLEKRRPRWDPEIWDHKPIFKGPFMHWRALHCAIALGKLTAARAAKPPRPARVVWSDNITRIDAPNPCAGSMLRIYGTGFGDPKPANVGLMLPTKGKCTPTAFVPGSWRDDRVEIVMPPGITSGPIGFVDIDYVAAYNVWVDGVNNALQTLVLEGCGRSPKAPLEEPFHECPPSTPVNALYAGEAYINAFTVNGESFLVAEPGDVLTFSWDVVNATRLTLQRTSSSGPVLPGTGKPLLLEVGSIAITATHPGPETWTYRLRAEGRCGDAVADVTVIATRQPRLSIETIEVTQGLQTIPATIRMVARKETVVRVTVRHALDGWGANSVPGVVGRIRVHYPGGLPPSAWLDAANASPLPMRPNPGASITVSASPDRQNVDDTLNFHIPGALCTGNPTFRVEVRVNGFDARGGFGGFWEMVERSSAPVAFEARRIVELRWVRLNWSGTITSQADCERALREAVPMLPTPTANIAAAPVGVVMPLALDMFRDALDQLDDLHNCSDFEALTEWLGSDCPDEDDTKWVGVTMAGPSGGLAQRPGNVCIVSPTVSFTTVAHELSHNFDQRHLTSTCAGGTLPDNAENASGFPDAGQINDVPFNVLVNNTVTSATGVWDVMTYCSRPDRWPSFERWRRLWDQIG